MLRPQIPGLVSCILLLSLNAYAQKPHIAREPSWVSKTRIDYSVSGSSGDIEDGILDIAIVKQIDLASQTTYYKKCIKIVTDVGVQNGSTVSVSYDPAYQHLIFHHIHIIRGSTDIDKLNFSKIKTIRQETELSRSVYNGSLTSMLFLEDTRKGDVIEYDYSLLGFNPVFKGKYAITLAMQFSVPVGSLFYRIICPANRDLTLKNYLTDIQPVISRSGTDKIYEWSREKVAALKSQDELPSWYEPYSSVMVSEYKSWNEVAQWALSLFSFKGGLSAGLKRKIEEIRSEGSSADQRLLSALRFVQDEVRYLGIEIGVNTHKPNDPDKIFAQRFGDCKDKSFLLTTMLRSLGIEAAPILINTENKKALYGWLPSPLDFNHCAVRVNLAGKSYWLDPTISYQRGDIDAISFPDFQCGLVLLDTSTCLSVIPLQDSGQVYSRELFTMEDLSGPAKLEVTRRYSGSFADEMRSQMNSNSLSELQQNYLDFYNDFYKDLRVRDSLKIEDDEKTGLITTHEYYTVDKLWDYDKGTNKASFYGLQIGGILKKPREHDRRMPIAISYPEHFTEEIEVSLPEDWNFESEPTEIISPAYKFNFLVSSTSTHVNLKYEYRALNDHISVEDSRRFLNDYDKMKDALGYELTKKDIATPLDHKTRDTNSDTLINLLKLLGCIVLVVVIVLRVKRH